MIDALLHRYGGGVDEARVARLLRMPFSMLVRLMGAAQRANNPPDAKGTPPRDRPGAKSEEEIVKELDAKVAALRGAK